MLDNDSIAVIGTPYVEEEYANGIYYFKDEVVVGSNPLEKLNLHDEVIELGLTPNI